jgi:hypothetical protein
MCCWQVTVLQDPGDGWIKVRCHDGAVGFCPKDYVVINEGGGGGGGGSVGGSSQAHRTALGLPTSGGLEAGGAAQVQSATLHSLPIVRAIYTLERGTNADDLTFIAGEEFAVRD